MPRCNVAALACLAVAAATAWSAEPSRMILWQVGKPIIRTPEGKEVKDDPLADVEVATTSRFVQLSPDGKRLAYGRDASKVEAGRLEVLDISTKKTQAVEDVKALIIHWLDRTHVVLSGQLVIDKATGRARQKDERWLVDVEKWKWEPYDGADDYVLGAIGGNGKVMLMDKWDASGKFVEFQTHFWRIGEGKPSPLFKENEYCRFVPPKFSSDGTKLLCNLRGASKIATSPWSNEPLLPFTFDNVIVHDLKTNKQVVLKELGEKPEWRLRAMDWSPDGNQVAWVETRRPMEAGRQVVDSFRVTIADADGKNAKEVWTGECKGVFSFDWR